MNYRNVKKAYQELWNFWLGRILGLDFSHLNFTDEKLKQKEVK